jgi:hypothetical protein
VKTSITIFAVPIGTAFPIGVDATASYGDVTVTYGSDVPLTTDALNGVASNVGVSTQSSHTEPINQAALTGIANDVSVQLGGALEADWLYRSTLDGVVWAHDFRNAAEVSQFRMDGTLHDLSGTLKPGTCFQDTGDGITGGACLQVLRLAGDNDPGTWWRPMAAVDNNGQPGNDLAAQGDVTVRAWNPVHNTEWSRFNFPDFGNYGPPSTGSWEGEHFWMQVQYKLDPRRLAASFPGGKIVYHTRVEQSLTAQECVTYYKGGSAPNFAIYKAGSPEIPNEIAAVPHIFNEWVTYLYRFAPGDENQAETIIEVWRQRHTIGEKEYTKIFQARSEPIDYQDIYPKAWNACLFSGYHNNATLPEFWQKYDQIIFSRQWIPPVSTFASSSLKTAADSLSAGQFALDPITMPAELARFDISWQNRTAFYDDERREIQFMGKAQTGGSAKHWIYDEETDVWRQTSGDVTPDQLGHIWLVTFDHETGDYYHIEQQPTSGMEFTVRYMDRSVESGQGSTNSPWTTLPSAASRIWSFSHTPNTGICIHPHLFGPGRKGLFCFGVDRVSAYNLIDGTWTHLGDPGSPYKLRRNSATLYIPGQESILIGGSKDADTEGDLNFGWPKGAQNALGAALPTQFTGIGLPLVIAGGAGLEYCHVCIDPTNNRNAMLLERTGSQRVYISSDGGATWTLQPYTHPFWTEFTSRSWNNSGDGGSYTVCSIPRYGVILGMSSDDGGGPGSGHCILWRPG